MIRVVPIAHLVALSSRHHQLSLVRLIAYLLNFLIGNDYEILPTAVASPHHYRAWTNFSFQDRRYLLKAICPVPPDLSGVFPFSGTNGNGGDRAMTDARCARWCNQYNFKSH